MGFNMYEIEFTPEAHDDLKLFRKFEQQEIIKGFKIGNQLFVRGNERKL